uniref:Phosphatidylethanolamine-binding protein n=1 Tax=Moniliophthora roreri TaxID=221103 RepID=A0A0W0EXP5_MONRR
MSSQPNRTTPLPSNAEVLAALRESHVIPDVLKEDPPLRGVLEIVYPSGANVIVNAKPHRDQVQAEPTIHFHPADALDSESSYALIMTDPDLMQPNDPKNKQVRHWVITSLKPRVSETPTYAELQRTSSATHTTFLPSAPMPSTGPHRYVFILAKGLVREPTVEKEKGRPADFNERLKFEADAFIKENNLEVVGVAFMSVQPTLAAGVDDVKLMAESVMHSVTGK